MTTIHTSTIIHTRQLTTIHTRQLTTTHTRQLTTIHTGHLKVQHVKKVNNTKIRKCCIYCVYFITDFIVPLLILTFLRLKANFIKTTKE